MGIEAVGIVVEDVGAPARLERIEVEQPGRGEVLVRIEANGICHSDHWAIQHGNRGSPMPMLLGHEGAGIVEAVGDGVEHPLSAIASCSHQPLRLPGALHCRPRQAGQSHREVRCWPPRRPDSAQA